MKKNKLNIFIYFCGTLSVLCNIALVASEQPAAQILAGKERRYFSLGQLELALQFVKADPANLEMRDKHGWTPVGIAAIAGHIPLVEHLTGTPSRFDSEHFFNILNRRDGLPKPQMGRTDTAGKYILEHVVTNPHSLPMVQLVMWAGQNYMDVEQKERVLQVLDERIKNGAQDEKYQEIKNYVQKSCWTMNDSFSDQSDQDE